MFMWLLAVLPWLPAQAMADTTSRVPPRRDAGLIGVDVRISETASSRWQLPPGGSHVGH
jgi:hypothetical protein